MEREDARRLALGVYNGNKFRMSREVVRFCLVESNFRNTSYALRNGPVAYREAAVLCIYLQEPSDHGIVPNVLFVSLTLGTLRVTKALVSSV